MTRQQNGQGRAKMSGDLLDRLFERRWLPKIRRGKNPVEPRLHSMELARIQIRNGTIQFLKRLLDKTLPRREAKRVRCFGFSVDDGGGLEQEKIPFAEVRVAGALRQVGEKFLEGHEQFGSVMV